MKNKFLKFSFLSLILISSFLFSKNVLAADTLDYTSVLYGNGCELGAGGWLQGRYQLFQPTHNNVSKIFLKNVSSNVNNVIVSIYDASFNVIGSTNVDYTNMSDGGVWVVFSTPVTLVPNNVYYLGHSLAGNAIGLCAGRNDNLPNLIFNWDTTLKNYVNSFDGYHISVNFDLYYESSLVGPPACQKMSYMYLNLYEPYEYSDCSLEGIQYRRFLADASGNSIVDGCNPATAGSVMPESRNCNYSAPPSLNSIYDLPQTCYAGYPCNYTFNYFADNNFTETDTVRIYQCGSPITIGDIVNLSTCDTTKTLVDTTSFDTSALGISQTPLNRISTFPKQYLSADVIYEIQIYDSANTILKADLKTSVRWLKHAEMPSPTVNVLTASSTALFGNAHTMACNATDWADSSWWTQIRCGTGEALLFIPYTIIDALKAMIYSLADAVAVIFPFNIPAQVFKSWQDSATAVLPAQFNWLKIADSQGNVYIHFPAALSGSAQSTPILVWGHDIFTPDGSTLATLFGHIKDFSVLGLYLAFIYGVWATGKKILNEIGFINHEEKIRKTNYQL